MLLHKYLLFPPRSRELVIKATSSSSMVFSLRALLWPVWSKEHSCKCMYKLSISVGGRSQCSKFHPLNKLTNNSFKSTHLMFRFKIKWIKQFGISLTGGNITRMSQIIVTLRVWMSHFSFRKLFLSYWGTACFHLETCIGLWKEQTWKECIHIVLLVFPPHFHRGQVLYTLCW